MKLIKTTLVVLIATIGFFSNAQEAKKNRTQFNKDDAKTIEKLTIVETNDSPEQKATQRAKDLKAKVQLTEEQFSKVHDLFVKVENRKHALKPEISEDEKKNVLNELQIMENKELDTILTPTQKKIISAPKTAKTATSM